MDGWSFHYYGIDATTMYSREVLFARAMFWIPTTRTLRGKLHPPIIQLAMIPYMYISSEIVFYLWPQNGRFKLIVFAVNAHISSGLLIIS